MKSGDVKYAFDIGVLDGGVLLVGREGLNGIPILKRE